MCGLGNSRIYLRRAHKKAYARQYRFGQQDLLLGGSYTLLRVRPCDEREVRLIFGSVLKIRLGHHLIFA
jgi:hypothetical protein